RPALRLLDRDSTHELAVAERVVDVAFALRQPILLDDLSYLSLARLGFGLLGVAAVELLVAGDLLRLRPCALSGLLLRGRGGRRRFLLLAVFLLRPPDLFLTDEAGFE